MTFLIVMGVIIAICGGITALLFRKGGPYNPVMPSLDRITEIPLTPPEPPKQPQDKIRVCALAQQTFEGWYPGSNSYRHNNPGNCKNASGFITFKTYEEGFAYLEDYIRRVATGQHHAYPKGGKTTIEEYTRTYTSDPSPSPENYASAIARALGVPTSTTMDYLLV